MAAESGGSEAEEPPWFPFLGPRGRRQPAGTGTGTGEERGAVLISSSPPAPGWAELAGGLGGSEEEEEELVPLSERLRGRGGSEEEEEELVPLSERLRRRGGSTLPPKPRSSEPRPPAPQARGPTHCQVTKLAPRGPGQSPPKATGARVTCWELSDSDQDDAPPDPQRAPWHPSPAQRSRSPGPYPSSQMSPPLKKSRHGQEEKERARQAALQQRREQKWQQEQERERRKALADRLKAQRPAECLKYITVVLDPALLQVEGGGQILSALQAMDCCCVIESQAVPCSITWRRRSGSSLVEESSWIEELNILVLLHLENFLSMICNYRQEVHGGIGGPKETLRSFVASVREKAPRKTLALAVVELEKYFRSHKVQSRKKLRQAVLNGNQVEGPGKRKKRKEKEDRGPELSRMEVEEALVDLQLHTGVQLRILESWKELGDFASMFTKAVAEAPFKQERGKTSFSFYLESDWCGGVKVDRSGKGLSQVWKRQIQQFNRVSPEMANAIAAAYPSPLFLSRAYQSCLTEQERQNMLADIPVRRGDGVTATSRRVGPELSKRIYLQMTSYNPDLSLDVTG